MAFEGLSDKLGKVFGKLKNHGKLNEKEGSYARGQDGTA